MKVLLAIAKAIDSFTYWLGYAMGWVSLAMIFIGALNVITRYAYRPIAAAFGRGVAERLSGNVYLELQVYAYTMVFLLGASYVLKSNAHVRIDILYSRLSAKVRAWVDVFGALFFLLPFSLLAIYYSYGYVMSSWQRLEMSPNPGGLPVYPLKSMILAAFILLIAQALSDTIKNIAFIAGRDDSGSIHAQGDSDALVDQLEAI